MLFAAFGIGDDLIFMEHSVPDKTVACKNSGDKVLKAVSLQYGNDLVGAVSRAV